MAFRPVAWPALLLVACFALPAHAEPSENLKEVARNLMAEGRELREKDDHGAALSRFQAADAIMSVPTTSFEVARSQADLGQLLEARETLRRVLSLAEKPDDPEPFRAARMKARALDVELTQRIGGLRIVLRGPEADLAVVRVDSAELNASQRDTPLKLNPGRHRVIVSAAGQDRTREVEVPERETVTLEIDLAPSVAPKQELPSPTKQRHDAAEPASPASSPRKIPTLAYVGGGVAAVGVIVGSVSGVWAMNKKSEAWAGCKGSRCPPSTWESIDAAQRFATVSTVGFVVAGVGATVGVGALLFARKSSDGSASLELRAAPGRVDLAGSF